ncbi:MAG: hypothetical protein K0Q55_3025 [Verrucomicrobia bacterium]|nr:hypothetical protein [Verrucomicrobiota bacterium]
MEEGNVPCEKGFVAAGGEWPGGSEGLSLGVAAATPYRRGRVRASFLGWGTGRRAGDSVALPRVLEESRTTTRTRTRTIYGTGKCHEIGL